MHQKEKDQALAEARQFRIKFKHLEAQMKDEITQLTGKKKQISKNGVLFLFSLFFPPSFLASFMVWLFFGRTLVIDDCIKYLHIYCSFTHFFPLSKVQ